MVQGSDPATQLNQHFFCSEAVSQEPGKDFGIEDGLFLRCSAEAAQQFDRTWIFDADDTLWEDNLFYEKIISAFGDFITGELPEVSAPIIRKIVDDIEREIVPVLGFGPLGFQKSMELAYERIRDSYGIKLARPAEILDSIIPTLCAIPQYIALDTIDAIRALRERGDGLVLFTQGDLNVQTAKVARSGLAGFFHAVAVTPRKTVDAYQKLMEKLPFKANAVTVVGNSLASDVAPAVELGFNAIHFLNPNTWSYVNEGAGKLQGKYRRIDKLSEVLLVL